MGCKREDERGGKLKGKKGEEERMKAVTEEDRDERWRKGGKQRREG